MSAKTPTVDSSEAHTLVHVGPMLFLPCCAGHSEYYGQVRVKDGTGEPECLKPFAIPSALSFIWGGGGGLKLPELCGVCVDLSCPGTVGCP